MRFGVSVPTCKEGLSLPLPYADVQEVLRLIELAEQLGFDSVWGNDHVTAPAYVAQDYDEPPRFYDLLTMLTAGAARTRRITLGTAVLVLPLREPVLLAKQLATLDHISGGRLLVGVGTGAYREEFERARPGEKTLHRGRMLEEGVDALQRLFMERRASFQGRYYAFDGVELFPKPLQDPLPLYMGGNDRAVIRRAALMGHGWLPAAMPPAEIQKGRAELRRIAADAGRDPGRIDVAPQLMCCLGRTQEEALVRFRQSRLYVHLASLGGSTLRHQALAQMEQVNLVGSEAEVTERVGRLEDAGVTTIAAIGFISESVERMAEDMQRFAEGVMPHFRPAPARVEALA